MSVFYTLAFLFLIGSVSGWVIEVFFRRFFSAHKWINPGFLTGPYVPLYGFGVSVLYFLSRIDMSFIPNTVFQKIVLILIMSVVITFVEYLAGIIFIKGLKTKLWDYSDRWGNIQGIICPLFSFFWTVIAAAYNLLLDPYIVKMAEWFISNSFYITFFIGIIYGIMLVDFVNSINLVARIKTYATEKQIVVKWEQLKATIAEKSKENKERVHFMFPFLSKYSLKDQLENYANIIKKELEKNLAEAKEKMESLKNKAGK